MSDFELEAEVVAEEDASPADAEPVRALPLKQEQAGLPVLSGEVRSAALAAAGGVLAGAATVAAVRAVSHVRPKSRASRRFSRRRDREVVASRSFLVDVHLLGR